MMSNLIPSAMKCLIKRFHPSYHRLHCNLCNHNDRAFVAYGLIPRTDAMCPKCGSLERHRFVWEFFQRSTNLHDGRPKKMLHVAPEPSIEPHLRNIRGLEYVTADLADPAAMLQLDVANIQLPDSSFEIVYCSHVLEHVPDDRKAMAEVYRILKPGGWAVFMVPIHEKPTFEDPSVVDPMERERLFGQNDHVRIYGMDFSNRLASAGFQVRTVRPLDVANGDLLKKLAVTPLEWPIFFCNK